MSEDVSTRTKIGFGICDLGGNLFFTMMGFYLLYFLTDLVGLAAGLAGTALMIGKIWDAVTDPAVGYLSDRTRSAWGRRRPYIFWGSILLFGAMIFMFTDPDIETQVGLFVWAAGAYCLLNTAYTLVNIPYSALLPELTSDYNQRTLLIGYRMSFAVVGTLTGAGLVLPLVGLFSEARRGWTGMSAIMGAVMLATAMATVLTVREPPRTEPVTGKPGLLTRGLWSKVFLRALIPWVAHIMGTTVIQGALLFYFKYIYGDEGKFQIALTFLLLTALAFIPVWVRISKKIGKRNAYNAGMLLFTVTVLLFFFFGEAGGVRFAYLVMVLAGVGLSTHYVMPHSIIPDVVEYDFGENGTRREGIYYGLWTFASKVGQALAIALSGWILSAFGYVALETQTPMARLGIALLCGPIPAVFFLIGVFVLAGYPITESFYQEILRKIRLREESTAEAAE